MLTVVTWLWKSTGWRVGYDASHVNTLEKMVAANLDMPHRFLCVTDMPEDINCETIPLWDDYKTDIPFEWPNCYRRLKAFSPDIEKHFGKRFISLDLDCVVMGDLTPAFSRKEDFVMLKGEACTYNGSMWMMDTGARKQVLEQFDPIKSPYIAMLGQNDNGKTFYGSDQAWISWLLGKGEAMFTKDEGIHQYTLMDDSMAQLDNARIVFFAGGMKPWTHNDSKDNSVLTQIQKEYAKYR